MSSGLQVVLGASGGVGNAVVQELVARGHQVRAVNRTGDAQVPVGVERMAANVERSEDAKRAVAGAAVVYHAAQPPYGEWPERFPRMNATILDAMAGTGSKLVFADNLYMYGPSDGPLREDTPQRATGPKGKTRIALARELLATHEHGDVRVTMGRMSDYYGPGPGVSSVSTLVLEPAVKGKAMRWLGDADQPHTLHGLGDCARGLVVLGERDEADGRAWHLPAAPTLTGRAFMGLVNEVLDTPVKIGVMGPMLLNVGALFNPAARESKETLYQFTRPFVADSSAFTRVFGETATTPHRDVIASTIGAMRARLAVDR